MEYSTESLCRLFGHSRQSYYQNQRRSYRRAVHEEFVLHKVHEIRRDFPRMGSRKMLSMLHSDMQSMDISIGRDAFFDLMSENGLLVKRQRNGRKTTNSFHRFHKYPNLIKGYVPTSPNRLWVSDITYVNIGQRFGYLSLITDAYSHKIVGWNLSHTLSAESPLRALDCALLGLSAEATKGLIHHSDRGVQYCSDDYVKRLIDHKMSISMTESGDPRDNAVAERVNGILKTEWLNDCLPDKWSDAKSYIAKVVDLYNTERPHLSISNLTPAKVHTTKIEVKRMWKNYYKKRQGNEKIATLPNVDSKPITVNPVTDDFSAVNP